MGLLPAIQVVDGETEARIGSCCHPVTREAQLGRGWAWAVRSGLFLGKPNTLSVLSKTVCSVFTLYTLRGALGFSRKVVPCMNPN